MGVQDQTNEDWEAGYSASSDKAIEYLESLIASTKKEQEAVTARLAAYQKVLVGLKSIKRDV